MNRREAIEQIRRRYQEAEQTMGEFEEDSVEYRIHNARRAAYATALRDLGVDPDE